MAKRVGLTAGVLMITLGILLSLAVVYRVWGTDLVAARKQQAANAELRRSWSASPERDGRSPAARGAEPAAAQGAEPTAVPEPEDGEPFGRLYIPRFGSDYAYPILEGLGSEALSSGVGHYPDSVLPGKPGNVAIAGHRLGNGGPFNELDEVEPCDAVVVETAREFLVYRVLPMADTMENWPERRRASDRCADVPALGAKDGPYGEVFGRRIVAPERVDAVAPVPYRQGSVPPPEQRHRLLTLTTCHPQYGDSERLIVHAVLTDRSPKSRVGTYSALLHRIQETGG